MPAAVPSAVKEVYASVARDTTSSGSSRASADAFVNSASRLSAWMAIERPCKQADAGWHTHVASSAGG